MSVKVIQLVTRDVKQSLKIQTLNKTIEFIFQPFDICLLTALCRTPQFVCDDARMECPAEVQ